MGFDPFLEVEEGQVNVKHVRRDKAIEARSIMELDHQTCTTRLPAFFCSCSCRIIVLKEEEVGEIK